MRSVELRQCVNLTINIDFIDYEFVVISTPEEEFESNGFVILLNNTHIGSLRIAEDCYWMWTEGTLGYDFAAAIGQGIENHYMD